MMTLRILSTLKFRPYYALFLLIGFLFIPYYFWEKPESETVPAVIEDPPVEIRSKALVVASLKSDDTSWIYKQLEDWDSSIYVVDDPQPGTTVPMNKGHESMAYLTYIIDHYENLPDIMVFTHGQRYQWHNDDPIYDSVSILRSLRLPFVSQIEFAPLRCTWLPGCPDELHPLKPTKEGTEDKQLAEKAYASAFKKLFPELPVPEKVGAPCSSQFAVSRNRVRQRSKASYERIRSWLLETDLSDNVSGRILEYMWHIIMQMPPVYCPPAGQCYCMTFGQCNLKCTAARCENRYVLPKYAQVPEGWPERGGGENGWPVPGWNEQ